MTDDPITLKIREFKESQKEKFKTRTQSYLLFCIC